MNYLISHACNCFYVNRIHNQCMCSNDLLWYLCVSSTFVNWGGGEGGVLTKFILYNPPSGSCLFMAHKLMRAGCSGSLAERTLQQQCDNPNKIGNGGLSEGKKPDQWSSCKGMPDTRGLKRKV